MSLAQVNKDLLLDFVNTLKKVAPLSSPKNDEELDLTRHWAQVAEYVQEICEPLAHQPGFDADAVYWKQLATSYRQEVNDYRAIHDGQ